MAAFLNFFSVVLALIGVIFATTYALFWYSYTYWKRKGVNGPKPSFPEGNFHGVFTKKKHISDPIETLYERYKKEPYIGVYALFKPVLIVNDLDLIKSILIKDFDHFDSHGALENEDVDPLSVNLFALSGERWRDMRSRLSPVFSSSKMKIMSEIMLDVQNRLVNHIDSQIKVDSVMDIKEILGLYTMDIIGSCGFGIECDSFNNPKSKFILFGKESVTPSKFRTQMTFLMSFLAPSLLEWLRMSAQGPDVIEFFTRLVEETVRHRELHHVRRNDLLQMLIELKNDETKTDGDESAKQSGRTFTSADLTAQAFLFVIAGYETSSSAASYALYWLARRPELQRRARQELRAVLARHGGRCTYDALQQLPYLTMVIEETLRLHPALNFLFRKCTKSYKIANSPLTLEKGTDVYVPVIGIHLDPELYPEPRVFNPERFTKEEKAKRHKSAYIPFGDGPRICIGARFAMLQVRLALAGYEVAACARMAPLQLDVSGLVTAPKGGVFLQCRKMEGRETVIHNVAAGARFAMLQVRLALAGVLAGYEVAACERTAPLQLDVSGLVTAPKGGVFLQCRKMEGRETVIHNVAAGARFAMLQVRLALAGVLAGYEVAACARTAPLQLDVSGLVTAPKGGVFLQCRKMEGRETVIHNVAAGARFAMLQVRLALAGVLAGYEVAACARTAPLQLDVSGLVTAPKGGVFLQFRKLEDLQLNS